MRTEDVSEALVALLKERFTALVSTSVWQWRLRTDRPRAR